MLDLALVRSDPDRVRRSARRRGQTETFVDRVLELDASRRKTLTSVEMLKAEKNELSAAIAKAADRAAEAARLRPQIAELDRHIVAAGSELPAYDEEIAALL